MFCLGPEQTPNSSSIPRKHFDKNNVCVQHPPPPIPRSANFDRPSSKKKQKNKKKQQQRQQQNRFE